MNKYTYIPLAFVLLTLPVGSALADDGHQGPSERDEEMHTSLTVEAGDDVDFEVHSSTTVHASDTPWMNGEKHGLEKRFGTTTPPGITHREDGDSEESSSTDRASTTDREDGDNNGHKNGPFVGFWQWLFGHPATTTVADIKAELEATSTASTTGPGTETAQGEGFFAHFLNFFRPKH